MLNIYSTNISPWSRSKVTRSIDVTYNYACVQHLRVAAIRVIFRRNKLMSQTDHTTERILYFWTGRLFMTSIRAETKLRQQKRHHSPEILFHLIDTGDNDKVGRPSRNSASSWDRAESVSWPNFRRPPSFHWAESGIEWKTQSFEGYIKGLRPQR